MLISPPKYPSQISAVKKVKATKFHSTQTKKRSLNILKPTIGKLREATFDGKPFYIPLSDLLVSARKTFQNLGALSVYLPVQDVKQAILLRDIFKESLKRDLDAADIQWLVENANQNESTPINVIEKWRLDISMNPHFDGEVYVGTQLVISEPNMAFLYCPTIKITGASLDLIPLELSPEGRFGSEIIKLLPKNTTNIPIPEDKFVLVFFDQSQYKHKTGCLKDNNPFFFLDPKGQSIQYNSLTQEEKMNLHTKAQRPLYRSPFSVINYVS